MTDRESLEQELAREAAADRWEVSVAEAAAVTRQHERAGTCPNCGAKVESFCSFYHPSREGVTFCCPECSPLAAAAVAQGQQVREGQHRRN